MPFSCGLDLAATIPNAQFVELDSRNHILMEHEPAWQRFQDAVLKFAGQGQAADQAAFEALSEREHAIQCELIEWRSNADIGRTLLISEKTVRNHVTRI